MLGWIKNAIRLECRAGLKIVDTIDGGPPMQIHYQVPMPTIHPAQPKSGAGTPLRIPYGNKDVALKLGARYGSAGWYAPPGVDLAAFGERGWL